jgi:hypothetical protein
MKRGLLSLILLISLISGFGLPAAAQNPESIGPNTQKYIDNLNEVREAQNDGHPVNNQTVSGGTSVWNYVFYGALSGAVYAFWRWLKRLRNGD